MAKKKKRKPVQKNKTGIRALPKGKYVEKNGRKAWDGSFFRNHKSIFIIMGTVFFLLLGLLFGYQYILTNYTVTTSYVEGNVHYTDEEILDMVMAGHYGNNSLFLSMKYRNKSISGVPFVEKMDVSVIDPHTIKIEVYEKALAGYVEYLENYMYFDKDGIVVESSNEKTKGIPLVTGLQFDHVVLYEPLPVDNPEIFKSILSITQLANKYNLSIDRIYFGSDNTLTLYFNEVRVALGNAADLDEKLMKLQYMLPELEGKSGVLRMENYTGETKNISFEPD